MLVHHVLIELLFNLPHVPSLCMAEPPEQGENSAMDI